MRPIITMLLLTYVMVSHAQLFENKIFYPGVKHIKSNSFNGTGIGRYWNLKTLDSMGRTIQEEQYRNKQLLGKIIYTYNDNNDKITEITLFDINNKNKTDTNYFIYTYDNNKLITNQSYIYNKTYFTTYDLVLSAGDSIFKFNCISKYDNHVFTIIFNNNREIKTFTEYEPQNEAYKKTEFTYDDHGNLLSHKVQRNSKDIGIYTGGPGGDDEKYINKYDQHGRLIKYWLIVFGKKYKIGRNKYIN
ncbi:MAG: hypothetical protein WAT91_06905 [Saprospiraceae bacterium]